VSLNVYVYNSKVKSLMQYININLATTSSITGKDNKFLLIII